MDLRAHRRRKMLDRLCSFLLIVPPACGVGVSISRARGRWAVVTDVARCYTALGTPQERGVFD